MDIFEKTDKKGQEKVIPILYALFSGASIEIEQHWEDKGAVDILMTATTSNGNIRLYAIECKDRDFKHNTQFKDGGWILEKKKYYDLMDLYLKGYKPLYFNTFNDNTFIIWDVSKINPEVIEKVCKKTTVVDRGKQKKPQILLDVKDYICSGHTS